MVVMVMWFAWVYGSLGIAAETNMNKNHSFWSAWSKRLCANIKMIMGSHQQVYA